MGYNVVWETGVLTSSWEDGEVSRGKDVLTLVLKDEYDLAELMGSGQREEVDKV